MKKIKFTLLLLTSLLMSGLMNAQVQDSVVTEGFASNYSNNITKVDWNWDRVWINSSEAKTQHAFFTFSVGDFINQTINSVSFNFNYDQLKEGTASTISLELFYKPGYTSPQWEAVDYPSDCVVLGTIDIAADAAADYVFTNEALKTYIADQITASENATIIIRTTTPDVKIGLKGKLQKPVLVFDVPAAFASAPSVSITKPAGSGSDLYLSTIDTIKVEFSKAMDQASVEGKIKAGDAVTPSFVWQGDTTVLVAFSGLTEWSEVTVTVEAGALALDASTTKIDKELTYSVATAGIIKSENNFWIKEDGNIGTNALSLGNGDFTDEGGTAVIYLRKSVMYFNLEATTAETEFKGILMKKYNHQDGTTWEHLPVGDNVDYKLYEVPAPEWGVAFDQVAYDGLTATLVADIVLDSTNTIFELNSQVIIDYLVSKAGQKICLVVVDETASDFKATTWISDGSGPNNGAPLILYSMPEAASLSSVAASQVSLFPQPSNNGILNVKGAEVTSVEVYSLLGAQLMQQNVVANQVNVATLNAGVYFLKMNTNKGQMVKQFVIQ